MILSDKKEDESHVTTYNPYTFVLRNSYTDKYFILSPNVDRFMHTLPVLWGTYGSAARYVRAVAERQQRGRSVLSTDDNFSQEGEEVRLVEMHNDVIATSSRSSIDVKSFLKAEMSSWRSKQIIISLTWPLLYQNVDRIWSDLNPQYLCSLHKWQNYYLSRKIKCAALKF